MKWSAAAASPASGAQLARTAACLALALGAHAAALPVWLLATVLAAGAIRLGLAARGRYRPPALVRIGVSIAAVALLFAQFHTFNGLEPGTALLALMAGLKLLETESRRDLFILTLIIYFLNLSALLHSESFWLLGYSIGVTALATAALLPLEQAPPAPDWRRDLRLVGRVMAQALPLAVILWLFFPRFDEPLWRLPSESRAGESGLSDSMSPGDITALGLSDEIAFRVRFAAAVPPPRERYWRGPVLHDFDGRTWRRTDSSGGSAPPVVPEGPAYRYRLSLEPSSHNWLFALDWPAAWDLPRGHLNGDYMLVQQGSTQQPLDVTATSYTHARTAETLSAAERRRDTRLPPRQNPRTLELAARLRAANPGETAYLAALLDLFRTQPFYYTLTPPALGQDSVDHFLFDTRQGYCGHYASAFAVLARAAGIPARVVTGYQGGSFNGYADYWIVRQSDAHAWDEVWVAGRGWLRVDPTAVLPPERIEHELTESAAAAQPFAARWHRHTPWLADLRLRLDALHQLWRERILAFDQQAQIDLLERMHVPNPDGQKLVVALALLLALALAWLTWQVRREFRPRISDPVVRAYGSLCRKLAAAGLPRRTHEGPLDYAARVARERPDLAAAAHALCGEYAALRYGAGSAAPSRAAREAFIAGVRSFRPRAAHP